MAVLRVVAGPTPGQLLPLEKERTVIGRLPSCDVVLEMGSVSRQHVQILRQGDEFFIELTAIAYAFVAYVYFLYGYGTFILFRKYLALKGSQSG